jgi:hypothetical protein
MPNRCYPIAAANALARASQCFILIGLLALAACGGGGGNSNDGGVGGGTTVTISGKITFDRVPFKTAGSGLAPDAPVESPARLVVVEAVATTGTIVATTSTDIAGNYSLAVPANTQVKLRAKAQMLKTGAAPTWNFRVLSNTNSDALYAIEGATATSGTVDSTRNLHAESGWNGSSYATTRAAAPFAILDTVYRTRALIVDAVSTTAFPGLNLFWSPTNKPNVGSFCPDDGDVTTTLYITFTNSGGRTQDDCGNAGVEGIYILGDFANGGGDTDEFDQHVIAHEFGHYVEEKFSRADSLGGDHSIGERLDLRVAFGEGWGNAFSGMVLNDPAYRDSQNGQGGETGFNMEADGSDNNEGWYSEASVAQILWDIFDSGTESGDTVSLGFAPIYAAITGAQKTTDALTSIYSFSAALIAGNASSASGIRALLTREEIAGNDAFGTGETNFAGKALLDPTYTSITLGASIPVCGTRDFGIYNKLGNRRFLRFDLATSRAVQITAQAPQTGTPPADPDIYLWHRGAFGSSVEDTSATEIYNTPVLSPGTYVIEVSEFSHIDLSNAPNRRSDTCITVTVS